MVNDLYRPSLNFFGYRVRQSLAEQKSVEATPKEVAEWARSTGRLDLLDIPLKPEQTRDEQWARLVFTERWMERELGRKLSAPLTWMTGRDWDDYVAGCRPTEEERTNARDVITNYNQRIEEWELSVFGKEELDL
jgi:hypothetical protein